MIFAKSMVEFISDIIGPILIGFILGVPGAFILWSLRKFEGSYSDVLAKHEKKSMFLGLCFWIIIAVTIFQIVQPSPA